MTRADEIDSAIARGASNDQCRELAGHRALGENAIRYADHSIERQLRIGQAAKGRVQVAHQHRSSDAFARNIAEQKHEA